MDELCLKTVKKMVIYNAFEMRITQHVADCCKVPFVSRGPNSKDHYTFILKFRKFSFLKTEANLIKQYNNKVLIL